MKVRIKISDLKGNALGYASGELQRIDLTMLCGRSTSGDEVQISLKPGIMRVRKKIKPMVAKTILHEYEDNWSK
jgi:hypothetical protein